MVLIEHIKHFCVKQSDFENTIEGDLELQAKTYIRITKIFLH